jgi:hypothetical protein
MRQGQLLGFFGICFGIFAIVGALFVIPTVICSPLGIVCGVRAMRRKQRVLGIIGISLCGSAVLGLLLLVLVLKSSSFGPSGL